MIKKEIKKYITLNNKYKNNYDIIQEYHNLHSKMYYEIDDLKKQNKTIEEIKEIINNKYNFDDESINKKTIENKIINIEKNIIYNNIIYLIYKEYDKKINDIILNKYNIYNKNIGEKTIDKIENDIENILKNDFTDNEIYIHFHKRYESYERYIYILSIEIRQKNKNNYYNYDIKLSFNYGIYNNCYDNIKDKKYYDIKSIYNYNDDSLIYSNMLDEIEKNNNYNYIDDTKKVAKNIYKLSETTKKDIDIIVNKIKEKRNNLHNNLYKLKLNNDNFKQLEINSNINIF